MDWSAVFYLAVGKMAPLESEPVYHFEVSGTNDNIVSLFERFTHFLLEPDADFLTFSQKFKLNDDLFAVLSEAKRRNYEFRLLSGKSFDSCLIEAFYPYDISYWRKILQQRSMTYEEFWQWSKRSSLHVFQAEGQFLLELSQAQLASFWHAEFFFDQLYLAMGGRQIKHSCLHSLPSGTYVSFKRSRIAFAYQIKEGECLETALAEFMLDNGWRENSWQNWQISLIPSILKLNS